MFLRNYCNSPIYDPEHEKEFEEKPCLNFFTNIDKEKGLDQADQGVLPKRMGTFHM